MSDETPKLTRKQQLFIDYYLQSFNASEAARRAGYSESRARITGSELLSNSNISEQIQSRLDEVHMSANEALKLQADIARGDMGEFLDTEGIGFNLDLQDAKTKGLTKLIKKIKQKTTTFLAKKESEEDREVHELEIELYPADAAQDRIMRVHGVYKDTSVLGEALMSIVKKLGVDTDKL